MSKLLDSESAEKLNILEEAVTAAPDEAVRVQALNDLAWALHSSDCRRGIALAEQAGALARQLGDDSSLATSLRTLAWEWYTLGDYKHALCLLEEALPLCRSCGERRLETQILNNFGVVYDSLGQYDRALEYYFQVLALIRDGSERRGESTLLNNIGYVFMALGDYDAAMEYFTQALDLARHQQGESRINQTYPLSNIGQVCGKLGDHAHALQAYGECLEIHRSVGNEMGEAEILACVATCRHALGRDEEALAACRDGLALARAGGYRLQEAALLQSEAGIVDDAGRPEEARALYLFALDVAVQVQEHCLEVDLLDKAGRLSLRLGDLDEAHRMLQRALHLAQESGHKEGVYRAHAALADVCEQSGEPAAALAHHRRFYAIEKEVFDDRSDKRTRALITQMEVEKAQREAELHRLRSVELGQANAVLQTQAELLQAQAEELQAQAEELERQATQDGLTGLHNRRSLEGILARGFAEAKRDGTPLTVALVDLDHFKGINDRFGHQTGDEVLMTLAQLFRRACRASDMAARYGGEEFALVLPGTAAEEGRNVCERLRRDVERYPWDAIRPALSVTVSVGLSDDLSVPNHERLLGLADEQLYEAKHLGRNRVIAAATLSGASRLLMSAEV